MGGYETGRFADVDASTTASVRSAADLGQAIARLRDELLARGQEQWTNATLDSYLDALAALLEGQGGAAQPTWAGIAELIVAATGYE